MLSIATGTGQLTRNPVSLCCSVSEGLNSSLHLLLLLFFLLFLFTSLFIYIYLWLYVVSNQAGFVKVLTIYYSTRRLWRIFSQLLKSATFMTWFYLNGTAFLKFLNSRSNLARKSAICLEYTHFKNHKTRNVKKRYAWLQFLLSNRYFLVVGK